MEKARELRDDDTFDAEPPHGLRQGAEDVSEPVQEFRLNHMNCKERRNICVWVLVWVGRVCTIYEEAWRVR